MVAYQYGLDHELSCRFYVLGLHDNYLIESHGQKYIEIIGALKKK